MNENLNLCELLKGHEGETFYFCLCGNVILKEIDESKEFPICISYGQRTTTLTKDGKWWNDGECSLFPSKDQRDWNKWAEQQKPKTWDDFIKSKEGLCCTVRLTENIENNHYYSATIPIHKSILALLKIHQLIEVGYGGNITTDEWCGSESPIHFISPDYNTSDVFGTYKVRSRTDMGIHHIAFHTYEQAKEFLSHHENIQLIKDFYMI